MVTTAGELYATVAKGRVTSKKEYYSKLSVAIAAAVTGYKQRMHQFLDKAGANPYAYGYVPQDTGKLLKSGHSVIDRSYASGTEFAVFWGFSAPHAAYINFGYPAKRAFPPPSALMGWAQRHPPKGGGLTDKQWAFLIARAIHRRGLKGRYFFEPGLERAKAIFQQELQTALDFAFPGLTKVRIS